MGDRQWIVFGQSNPEALIPRKPLPLEHSKPLEGFEPQLWHSEPARGPRTVSSEGPRFCAECALFFMMRAYEGVARAKGAKGND